MKHHHDFFHNMSLDVFMKKTVLFLMNGAGEKMKYNYYSKNMSISIIYELVFVSEISHEKNY